MKNTIKKLLIVSTTLLAVSSFSSCTQNIEDDLFSQVMEDSQNGKDGKGGEVPKGGEEESK